MITIAGSMAVKVRCDPHTQGREPVRLCLLSAFDTARTCSGLPGALPPPPAAEEEASAKYFNLPTSGPPAVVNIALPPAPGIAPPPPPRFWTTHVSPNGIAPSFHESTGNNPPPFSGPSEDGSSRWKAQQRLAQHRHSGSLRKKGCSKIPVNESWDEYNSPRFVVSVVAGCVQMWAENTAVLPHMYSEDWRA